ncbi:hypothetical protein CCR87_08910 [Rhodobaculum claviforme]|uniref:Transmembrane protein n=1 Tax=Rhodobaculum claviforme TaxID=1549854 RepID=A0A934TKE0_9RHOB|nr:hypothetical protein [Rhodobaculum claviforme]
MDWPAIFAGGVFALALSFLLISFGATLGLSLASPYRGEGVSGVWLAIAAGIWLAWVMVTSFGAGGYLAGRMRRRAGDATADEVQMRDGAHGLMVWATGALVSTVLATAGVGGLVGVGASAVGTATDVATEAASSDYFANVMLRGSVTEPDTAATDGGAGPTATGTGGSGASQGQRAASADITGIDPAVQQQIAGIIARSAASGEIAERDRTYLAQLVAANGDMDQDAARARVDGVLAEIDEARATAIEAVEDVRVAGVIFGFIAAATLLLGAVAAALAAAAGGHHRDEGLGFDTRTARR